MSLCLMHVAFEDGSTGEFDRRLACMRPFSVGNRADRRAAVQRTGVRVDLGRFCFMRNYVTPSASSAREIMHTRRSHGLLDGTGCPSPHMPNLVRGTTGRRPIRGAAIGFG